jgi:CLIP-associating protein 1/2
MNRLQTTNKNQTIGANEDMFLKAFDSTPKLNIVTQKKLENELSRCITTISNPNADWDQRVQAMKLFRSLVNSGIFTDNDEYFMATLKGLEIPFQNNICDLRSQVVRETCITIAFLSCRIQQKFSRMAEMLLPSLIKLIPNSAKIISTSALVALRFIIQSTHNSSVWIV